jgi:hypothetical protein
MKTRFFNQCENEQDLLNRAKVAKDILDLDNPENKTLRVEVETEYQFLLNAFKSNGSSPESKSKEFTQKEILEKLAPLNLELEICGKWVWINGNTRPYKDILKELGLRFSPGKKCWYWRPDKYRSINKEPMDMNEIRKVYGSSQVALTN